MLKVFCKEKINLIEKQLQRYFPQDHPYVDELYQSMQYSLFAGGKRLRPILLLAAARAVGAKENLFLPTACSLEMIHTYSLIHDDLPSMDNDDYRRGKLTNHKVYGEAMAILSGDALLTLAFEVLAEQEDVKPDVKIQIISLFAQAAGGKGMIAGQVLDTLSEGKVLDQQAMEFMHHNKTGALFQAALTAGGILGNATKEQLQALTKYAKAYGLAFQITDDILDVSGNIEKTGKAVGSDAKNNKATYVSIFGLAQAEKMAIQTVSEAVCSTEIFGEEGLLLRQIAEQLISRDH